MKKLHYVRHGESEMNVEHKWGGKSDTPLTKEGHVQAKRAAQSAKKSGLAFDIIISSPLSRAHNTAKHIAEATGYPLDKIVTHELFIERDFGVLEGTVNDFPEWITNQRVIDHFEGVETADQTFERAKKAYEFLNSLPHDRILVVAHGAFGRAFRDVHNGKTKYEGGEGFPNAEIFELL